MTIIGSVCLKVDRAAPSSRSSISSMTICSYKSINFLSGSFKVWIARRTTSQCPLLMSAMNWSWESTVFRVTEVSSCKVFKVPCKLFSFKYCCISRTTLKRRKKLWKFVDILANHLPSIWRKKRTKVWVSLVFNTEKTRIWLYTVND